MPATEESFNAIGQDFDVVSTVDHPYPSPPVHLFDGHLRLHKTYGHRVLILNWDVSHPLDRFYRYDLITDTGLLAKNPSLYHYALETPYSHQTLDDRPWQILPTCLECAIAAVQKKQRLSDVLASAMARRAMETLHVAKDAHARTSIPWRYTAELLRIRK